MAENTKSSPVTTEFGCLEQDKKHAWIQMKSVFGFGRIAEFKGMITSFSDSFNSSWNEEAVFARMDPIATFQRTSRKISLTFKVVSAGVYDAEHNLAQVQRLIRMMYPVWELFEKNPTPQAAPLIDIKFSNLMRSTSGMSDWLSGYIGGLNVVHEVDAGFLFAGKNQDLMIPKEITLSFDFTVLHDHLLGSDNWGEAEKFGGDKYPYGAHRNAQKGDVKGNTPRTPADVAADTLLAGANQAATTSNRQILADFDVGASNRRIVTMAGSVLPKDDQGQIIGSISTRQRTGTIVRRLAGVAQDSADQLQWEKTVQRHKDMKFIEKVNPRRRKRKPK